MRRTIRNLIILIALSVAIKIFSLFPDAVEKYYSTGIYVYISKCQRWLLGWIPFSVGDLFYAFLVLVIIFKTVQFIKYIFKKKINRQYLLNGLKQVIFFFLFVYRLFHQCFCIFDWVDLCICNGK